MKAFCRGSNLRALLGKADAPDFLKDFQEIFAQFFAPTLPSLQGDIEALNDVTNITDSLNRLETLSDDTYERLLTCLNEGVVPGHYVSCRNEPRPGTCVIQPCAQEIYSTKVQGMTFSPSSKHIGNSRILFCLAGDSFQLAGEIQRIFVHQRHGSVPSNNLVTKTFYVVRAFRELNHQQAVHDPYRQFPLLFVRLCCNELEMEERIIRSDQIISHFAGCPYESKELQGNFLVVLSLSKVRPLVLWKNSLLYTLLIRTEKRGVTL